jgi:hypothetical protein
MMETLQKRPRLLRFGVFVAVIALFWVGSIMLQPKPVTRTKNLQFNDWMMYFMRQPGYTVEYMDFDAFEESMDVCTQVPAMSSLADHITLFSLLPNFEDAYRGAVRTGRSGVINDALKFRCEGDYPVTVYYDDEALMVFYIGLGSDPDLSYGYYTPIKAETAS